MKDALLGKCPPEITYLYKPISADHDEDTREDIAEAWVGGSPRIMAQPPRKPESHKQESNQTKAGEAPAAPDHKTKSRTVSNEPTVTVPPEPVSAAPQQRTHAEGQPVFAQSPPSANSVAKGKFLASIFLLISLAAVAWGIQRYWPSQHRAKPPVVAAMPVSKHVKLPMVNSDPPEQAVPTVFSKTQEIPQGAAHPTEVRNVITIENSTSLNHDALEAEKRQTRKKLIEGIGNGLSEQSDDMDKLRIDCDSRLNKNTNKITKLVRASKRSDLIELNKSIHSQIIDKIQDRQDSLVRSMESLQAMSSDPNTDPVQIGNQLTNFISTKEGLHQQINALMDSVDVAISNAPQKGGFLFFK